MKKNYLLLVFIALLTGICNSQNVTTLIGPDIGINDALVINSHGDIYGSNHEGTGVFKYSKSGVLNIVANFDTHPNGMVIDENDNIYVTIPQGNQIYKITPDNEATLFSNIPNPNGIIFQKDSDTLLVTSYGLNQIRKVDQNGQYTVWIESDDLDGPLGLCYDNNDVLYVSNFNDGKVFKIIDNELEYFATVPGDYVGSEYYSIGYITFLNNYIYASGFGKNMIYRIDTDGNTSFFAGSGEPGLLDGDANTAKFYYPNGIIPSVSGDSLYVTDYQTHTIRVINNLPLGINKDHSYDVENKFWIYTNPDTRSLYLASNFTFNKIKMFNVSGLCLETIHMKHASKEYSFDISDLKEGLYIVSVSNGEIMMSKKLLVRK